MIKQSQLSADWYKKDIEYWGFDFDPKCPKKLLSIGK